MTYTFKNHKRISIIRFCIQISFFTFVVLNLNCQDTGEKLLGLGGVMGRSTSRSYL
nr:Ig-like protein [Leptospira interrogans serovar Copenhageni/Icterohaemorrhagiae]